jgi:hypothetical protein
LGLDLGALGEQHPGWIDQRDLAIRRDLTGALRGIGAGHAVQHALSDGCWNWTCCLLPTSKLFQSIAARCDA